MIIINKFYKNESLRVSENFFSKLEEKLGKSNFNDAYYETFNNNREQGYVLKIYEKGMDLYIWACQCRNSDDIMIVLGCENECNPQNMFSEEAFKGAKYFHDSDYDGAIKYVYNHIKYMFRESLKKESHFKFDMYQNLEDIKRIEVDAKNLNYEDYFVLASFFDEIEKYSCDLVILEGKFGYQYKLHSDYGIETLSFENVEPKLDSEFSLMMDMQTHMNWFIDKELAYDIEIGVLKKMIGF